jgi:hypothetical protein
MRGVPAAMALRASGGSRYVFLAGGTFPARAGHPLHAALYDPDEPSLSRGRRCRARRFMGTAAQDIPSDGYVPVRVGARTVSVSVEAGTRVIARRRPFPQIRAGDALSVSAVRCGRRLVARRITAGARRDPDLHGDA